MKDNGDDKSANMYRNGDYVYFENSGFGLYAVRRIEELNKQQNGTVEARVTCFYRRNEIPASLIPLADKHHWGDSADMETDSDDEDSEEKKQETERKKLKSRELFLSRQVETLPASLIRGKCSVTLLSEVETIDSYCSRDDAFFYSLVFDPAQKTLQADKGSIRIGSEFQAQIPSLGSDTEPEIQEEVEMLWDPKNKLTEAEIEQFIIIARSVGTFARALDCSSSVKQPSLHMSAAAASRDITVFHAYQALHGHKYNMSGALSSLVPGTGPVLCRDEMEDWSSAEAGLFEEAIEKCGKDFNEIKREFLPWKSMKNIIEYFFMWKTTDRFVQQKRAKALEGEHKLKQMHIPEYSRKNLRLTGPSGEVIVLGRDCDAYPNMTKYSWSQYKKYGRFVSAVTTDDCFIIDRSANSSKMLPQMSGLVIEPGSPAKGGKTRTALFLLTSPLVRAARKAGQNRKLLKHHARKPHEPINLKEIRAKASSVLSDPKTVKEYCNIKPRKRPPMNDICRKLGQTDQDTQEWLILTSPDSRVLPDTEAFPRPAKRVDGSYIYEKIPSAGDDDVSVIGTATSGSIGMNRQQMFYKKRAYEEKPTASGSLADGLSAPKVGRSGGQARAYSVNQVAPKGKVAMLTRIAGGQKTIITWQDAPDDLFYKASGQTKKMRKHLSTVLLRRAARKPFRTIMNAK